jgi:LPS sulfotransferase NodH
MERLAETDMLSPWHDATEIVSLDQNPPVCSRLILLLAAPRSGSYHLCRLFWALGLGRPTEYFNPIHAHAWARFSEGWQHSYQQSSHGFQSTLDRFRTFVFPGSQMPGFATRLARVKSLNKKSLSRLIVARSCKSRFTNSCYFASKLQAGQLGSLANARSRVFLPQARLGLLAPFDQNPPLLVVLVRRDWQRALFSFHLSLCSGCFDDSIAYSYQHRPLSRMGKASDLIDDLRAYRRHLEWLVQCVNSAIDPLRVVAYEDLVADQDLALRRLLDFLEPVDQMPDDAVIKSLLNFRIHRPLLDHAWQSQRAAWLLRIADLFETQGLNRHPEAERCGRLTGILDAMSMVT